MVENADLYLETITEAITKPSKNYLPKSMSRFTIQLSTRFIKKIKLFYNDDYIMQLV